VYPNPGELDDVATVSVIYDLIREMAPEPSARVEPDAYLVGELGYDSLDLLELIAAIEETLGLPPFVEGDLTDMERISDLLRVVAEAQTRSAGERP
jgi:acyl carrier protein